MSLSKKIIEHFDGKVVRKDLTKQIKGNAIVPTYVLEYLLGQYCATDDPEVIKRGVITVKEIIAAHFVYRDEAQVIQSKVRERGSSKLIDRVSVELNDKRDRYEATFENLGLRGIPISDDIVKKNQKLLSSGVWCITTLAYFFSDERGTVPWIIEGLKPIQIASIDIAEFKENRTKFTKDEWVDLLMHSIGLNPEEFSFRSKLLQLTRLVPFAENNYNFIELGPKGTGKSHLYSELSPHGILISGGEVSKAKLFVDNSKGNKGNIGLVGYWDVVAYDEFAGTTKKVDRGLVDIMKNYMANKSFSRGASVYGASASMVFVGNTDHSVPYMLSQSDLFDALPKMYYDTAFLDRLHAYLPGWEVQKLRNEMFTSDYGFIVDYLAEVLKELRKEDFTNDYNRYFQLSDSITTRDKDAIAKTFSGLIKVIYPNGDYTEEQAKEILDFAIESRKRVKDQLIKMDETFEKVDFKYTIKSSGKEVEIETLEILEYGDAVVQSNPIADSKMITERHENPTINPVAKAEPAAKQVIIRDNQSGISFKKLFADYLPGATEITIYDPYVRFPYQMRNLMEFMKLVGEIKSIDEEVKVHLITSNSEEYLQDARKSFTDMSFSLEQIGIKFTYEFKDDFHDRSINLNNGWKIVMGRGLDIYQKTGGWYDITEYYQEKRACKACEITYLKEG